MRHDACGSDGVEQQLAVITAGCAACLCICGAVRGFLGSLQPSDDLNRANMKVRTPDLSAAATATSRRPDLASPIEITAAINLPCTPGASSRAMCHSTNRVPELCLSGMQSDRQILAAYIAHHDMALWLGCYDLVNCPLTPQLPPYY